MIFKSLSLLVPTRHQVPRLSGMWDSFVKTVGASNVEVIFRIDDDDTETAQWMRRTGTTVTTFTKPRFWQRRWLSTTQTFHRKIICGSRHDGYISLPRFFNEMSRYATGDLLMCGNDDMTFLTPEWPKKFLKAANQYPDGVFDLGCWTYPAGSFPFSVVSRRTVQRLGFLNDERLVYSDIFLRDVMAKFDRAILVPDVMIMHCGMNDHDANSVKWHVNTNAHEYWERHDRVVDEAVQKLRAVA